MASTSTRPGDFTPRAARTSDATDRAAFYERWLRVWVAIIAIVVVVVVVFLIFISNALASIDNNLGVTTNEVTGIGGSAKTLPMQINSVNTSLDKIYQDLAPVDGEAITVISNLGSIEGHLVSISGSLVGTNSLLTHTAGNLTTISGSLGNTEGVLTAISGLANQINGSLNNTEKANGDCAVPVPNGVFTPQRGSTALFSGGCSASQLSAVNIPQRLQVANDLLNATNSNLTNTSAGLVSVDKHLSSICNGLVVSVLKIVGGGTCA